MWPQRLTDLMDGNFQRSKRQMKMFHSAKGWKEADLGLKDFPFEHFFTEDTGMKSIGVSWMFP